MEKLGRQAGSALVQVMVAFTVVAGAIAIITNLLDMSKRSAETAAVNTEFQLLTAQLRSILEQELSCRIALGGPAMGYSPVTGSGGIPAHPQRMLTALNAESDIVLWDMNGNKFLDPNDVTANTFGRLKIRRLYLVAGPPLTTDSKTYGARLIVVVEKPPGMMGAPVISNANPTGTNLPLNVRLDSVVDGIILSCTGISFLDSSQALPICESDEMLSTTDANRLICVRVLCPPCLEQSPPGFFPYKADGSINCVWGGSPGGSCPP